LTVIQVVNFASKLTFVLCDFKVDDLVNMGDAIAHYMLELYAGNREMEYLIKRFLKEHPAMVFSRLTDRSIIATLNHTQTDHLLDGYRLYDYVSSIV
jgi:hypothetical protein